MQGKGLTRDCRWPIYRFAILGGFPGTSESLGWNLGGINGSGQVPDTGLPSLIDVDTPASVRSRIGFDGETYNLVFSDEVRLKLVRQIGRAHV